MKLLLLAVTATAAVVGPVIEGAFDFGTAFTRIAELMPRARPGPKPRSEFQ